ncbi:MAG: uroporphyrinogen decarboxylase [Lachnospiraceae bacterium]|nr:uroporphyrinogen decarboxylase [Lachnospiraceae bacterium]
MTKMERVRAAVTGGRPDILPYSFWSHFPGIDLDPVKQAEKTYEFYQEYDLDLVKTMNNGMYAIEDLGCKVDYSEIVQGGAAKLVYTPIQTPEDWGRVKYCSPSEGVLARELYALQLVLEKLKGENVPVIFTIFTPITIADKVSGKRVMADIRDGHGDRVKEALQVITETTADLAKTAIAMGADGVFMASQMSTYDVMTADLYREYGEPYDRQVLEACKGGWLNTIHAHGNNIIFEVLKDYPVNVFNWHAWETLPSLQEARMLTGKCLMGGIIRTDITRGNRNEILDQIFKSYEIMGGRNHILTPGCVVRYPLDPEVLHFVRSAKDMVEAAFKDRR